VSALSSASERVIDLDDLFRRYSAELNSYAYRRLADREAAADVVQDTFVRFLVWLRGREQPAFPHGPRSFLWRIVGNLTIDVIRERKVRGPDTPLDAIADLQDPQPTPDRHVEARQQYARVKAALSQLSPRARTALLLNRTEGLSHAEVGARLGVSSSMATKYIMAALAHCVEQLEEPV